MYNSVYVYSAVLKLVTRYSVFCMCACVYCVHKSVCQSVEARGQHTVSFFPSTLFIETRSLTKPGVH